MRSVISCTKPDQGNRTDTIQQVQVLAKAHNEKLPLQNRELKFKFLDITH